MDFVKIAMNTCFAAAKPFLKTCSDKIRLVSKTPFIILIVIVSIPLVCGIIIFMSGLYKLTFHTYGNSTSSEQLQVWASTHTFVTNLRTTPYQKSEASQTVWVPTTTSPRSTTRRLGGFWGRHRIRSRLNFRRPKTPFPFPQTSLTSETKTTNFNLETISTSTSEAHSPITTVPLSSTEFANDFSKTTRPNLRSTATTTNVTVPVVASQYSKPSSTPGVVLPNLATHAPQSKLRQRAFLPAEEAGTTLGDSTSTSAIVTPVAEAVSQSDTPVRLIHVHIGAGISVQLVCISIIIVIVKFRKEINILCITRCCRCSSASFQRSTSRPTSESKRYDAFLSFCTADESWVVPKLRKIEDCKGKFQFRFCWAARDFVAGEAIAINIIQSVEDSRHTVVFLSKQFLESEWCMFEFREAFRQTLRKRKRHLIVILMEDIPKAEMPKDVRRCLKIYTYINKDDILFWDRLCYAISLRNETD